MSKRFYIEESLEDKKGKVAIQLKDSNFRCLIEKDVVYKVAEGDAATIFSLLKCCEQMLKYLASSLVVSENGDCFCVLDNSLMDKLQEELIAVITETYA